MPRDVKIGMCLGAVLVAAAGLWLSMRPSLSIKSRAINLQSISGERLSEEEAGSFAANGNGAESSQARSALFDTSKPAAENRTEATAKQAKANKEQEYELTGRPSSARTESPRIHIVRSGESLSGISKSYYGTAGKWRMIYEANRAVLKNADKLAPGTKLLIPN